MVVVGSGLGRCGGGGGGECGDLGGGPMVARWGVGVFEGREAVLNRSVSVGVVAQYYAR